MKITEVETLRLGRHPNLIWVRLHTDAGITGLGETWFGAGVVEADIHDRVAPVLLGADPGRITRLAHRMRPYAGFQGTGAELRALSACEVALWDIAGKLADRPLHDLLGGRLRDRIRLYNTCAGPDYVSQGAEVRPGNFGQGKAAPDCFEDLTGFLERPAELAAELLDMGIASMKIWPFDFADGAVDGLDISAADLKRALEPFEAIRKVHGDRMGLKAELHGLWSLPAAQKICRALEPVGVDWVEDPVWMDRPDALRRLAETTSLPLAGGETLGGPGQIRALIDCGGIATPIVDVVWGGGVGFARDAAALAAARGLPIAFHDCSGPVTLTVSTHLAVATSNVREQEFTRAFYYGWYPDLLDRLPPIENGHIAAPPGAGLGVRLVKGLERGADTVRRVTRA